MRYYLTTFLLVALALATTVPIHSGFMVVILLPFIAAALIANTISAFRKPKKRPASLVRVSLWLAVPTIAGVAHWYLFVASRIQANVAAAAVVSYKARTGAWPDTLLAAGITDPDFEDRWRLGYLSKGSDPFLFYAATFSMFEAYTYNFSTNRWEFRPD